MGKMAQLLELSNYEGTDGGPRKKEAVQQLAKEYLPDVIVVRLLMPELDGYGVSEALSEDNVTKRIPFYIPFAKTEREDVPKAWSRRDDYLTKPFKEAELERHREQAGENGDIKEESDRKNPYRKSLRTHGPRPFTTSKTT